MVTNVMEAYISGAHSGPNPSPGLGTARSLRRAFPSIQLIAVDYSNRSSGIHYSDFDAQWIHRPWDELDLNAYVEQVQRILDSGAFWFSGLDLEALWLARTLGGHPNLFVPPPSALTQVAKPEIAAHSTLPMRIPPFINCTEPDWNLHAFCREYGWKVWLKGPYYEARRVRSWSSFQIEYEALASTWSTDRLFLQAHITGREESVAFCAHKGVLLNSVYMSKRDVTPEGKTWAGRISVTPVGITGPLAQLTESLHWCGGAELEFVRDQNDELWLIDWNPRFPAWIYGATIAGVNLPAALIQAITGQQPEQIVAMNQYFTRVVLEIPCKTPLPSLAEPTANTDLVGSKHPSGMPKLAKRLDTGTPSRKPLTADDAPPEILHELSNMDISRLETPHRVYFETTARARFDTLRHALADAQNSSVQVLGAYSIKTDPDPRLLSAARENGMLAEAISQYEVRTAISTGFELSEVILNGPGKWWPSPHEEVDRYYIVFADSVEELRRYSGLLKHRVGVRLRLPAVSSRFGIPVDTPESYHKLVLALRAFPQSTAIGLHFHLASSAFGTRQWWELYDSFLGWAVAIERSCGKRVSCIDIGGGWFPDDADTMLLPSLSDITSKAVQDLPGLDTILLEPGKALSQSTWGLITRLLEIRETDSEHRELIVDGAISDLPMSGLYPHRVLARNNRGQWRPLGRGPDRILGRLCMENDILADRVSLPTDICAGDLLVICDAGAYDRSMSYDFGHGGNGQRGS